MPRRPIEPRGGWVSVERRHAGFPEYSAEAGWPPSPLRGNSRWFAHPSRPALPLHCPTPSMNRIARSGVGSGALLAILRPLATRAKARLDTPTAVPICLGEARWDSLGCQISPLPRNWKFLVRAIISDASGCDTDRMPAWKMRAIHPRGFTIARVHRKFTTVCAMLTQILCQPGHTTEPL